MNEIGAETVYVTSLNRPAVNIGVSILAQDSGAAIDPWYLGAQDENTVQGFAGTPIDVNALTYTYLAPIGAAGAAFPRQGQFFVAVDSAADLFNGQSLAGRYILRSWVNDVTPPSLQFLTTRVSAGRPTLVFRTFDSQSGVDPNSLTIGYARRPRCGGLVRPRLRARGVPAAECGAGAQAGNGPYADALVRLSGGEEHRNGRAVDHAEHSRRPRQAARRGGSCGRLALPGSTGVPRAEGEVRRGGERAAAASRRCDS